jgi:diguanylate cyclase (GGDEF)-like protein
MTGHDRDLAELAEALRSGLELRAVLATANAAAAGAFGAEGAAAYVLADDGSSLELAYGDGPPSLPLADAEVAVHDGRTVIPMVSARRVLGCLVVDAVGDEDAVERARLVAAVAAQAVQAARLWDSQGIAAAGTLDALTGLPNRHGFAGVLARELARAKRTGASLAVSVVDIDGLARHNVQSHAEGDRVLRLAAECFSRGVRSYDCVCRIGGDSFALVLPGMSAESATTLVSRLAATFAAQAASGTTMTVSGGVASFPQNAGSQDELVQLARAALLDARAAGGGRISAHERDGHHGPQPDAPAPCAPRAVSADARATSEYAGLLAGELGLDADRIERLRLAAYVYGTADAAGVQARVAAGALDGESAEWILARSRTPDERPLETRILHTADAFVRAGGHISQAGAGRALAGLFEAGGEIDADCLRALERLLAADAA